MREKVRLKKTDRHNSKVKERDIKIDIKENLKQLRSSSFVL